MPNQDSWRDPILINTVGHSAGALLFCVIILLLIRDWRSHGLRQTGLSLIAAGLALSWNIGSLIVLGSADARSPFIAGIAAASFSMLTILPAVLLQLAVQGGRRKIVIAGYAVSLGSVLLHVGEGLSSGMPAQGLLQGSRRMCVAGMLVSVQQFVRAF